eukprot:scaffold4025_cov106-Cylindrotheca_fusiformis.AAC.7
MDVAPPPGRAIYLSSGTKIVFLATMRRSCGEKPNHSNQTPGDLILYGKAVIMIGQWDHTSSIAAGTPQSWRLLDTRVLGRPSLQPTTMLYCW